MKVIFVPIMVFWLVLLIFESFLVILWIIIYLQSGTLESVFRALLEYILLCLTWYMIHKTVKLREEHAT